MTGDLSVFLSSTSDLELEREALLESLRPTFDVYAFEEERAGGSSPESRCRRHIQRSRFFVCILGKEFGHLYPGSDKSIVQWELDVARSDPGKAIFPFIRHYSDDSQIDPRQQDFISQVSDFREGHWCRSYEDPPDLVELVNHSLMNWLAEYFQQTQRPSPFLQWGVIAVSCTVVLALLTIALTPLRELFTVGSMIATSCAFFCAVAMGATVLVIDRGSKDVR